MTQNIALFDGLAISPEATVFLAQNHKLLIDGDWVDGLAGETLATRDPATGLHLADVAIGGAGDIDLAVAAARWPGRGGGWRSGNVPSSSPASPG